MIHFCSLKILRLLIHYWTGLLVLFIAILEVRNLFCGLTPSATYFASLGVKSLSMSIDADRPSKLAFGICQTAMHLSSSLEGCTIAYTPVQLAENYFTSLFSSSRESNWGQDCDRLRHYERAQVGLECSKQARETLEKTLQKYR
jgi:hypothetical protein